MDIGTLDPGSLRASQIAQTSYILSLREIARSDPSTAAFFLNITKDDARQLAEMSIHLLETALHNCPPILTIKGQDGFCMRGTSPMAALLKSLRSLENDADSERFLNTVAHINAFTAPINNASIER